MSETPAQRRMRRRAEQAGLTDEQLRRKEDEDFARSKFVIQAGDLANAYQRQAESVPSFESANRERSMLTDALAAEARDRAAQGWSKHRIAAEFEVTTKTVGRWLNRPRTSPEE